MFWKCIFSSSAINPPFYAPPHFSKFRPFATLFSAFGTIRHFSFTLFLGYSSSRKGCVLKCQSLILPRSLCALLRHSGLWASSAVCVLTPSLPTACGLSGNKRTGWKLSRKRSMSRLLTSNAVTGRPFKAPSGVPRRPHGTPTLPVCRSWLAIRWTAAPVLYSSSKCCTTILHAADHFNLFIAFSFSSSGM